MGTDYTLACLSCRRAAYIDRHGWTIRSDDYVPIEFQERGYSEPSTAEVPKVTAALLEASRDRYLAEGSHGWNLLPVMVEWVRAHEQCHGPVVLLNDGSDYGVGVTDGEGWTTENLLARPGIEEIVSTPASVPLGARLSSPRGVLMQNGRQVATVTEVYLHAGPGKNPHTGFANPLVIEGTFKEITVTPEGERLLRQLALKEAAADATARGQATSSVRGGIRTTRFGTNDVRDLSAGAAHVECVRVYDDLPDRQERCGHRHKKGTTGIRKCAGSMGKGVDSRARGDSWVEVRALGETRPFVGVLGDAREVVLAESAQKARPLLARKFEERSGDRRSTFFALKVLVARSVNDIRRWAGEPDPSHVAALEAYRGPVHKWVPSWQKPKEPFGREFEIEAE